jgi:hypothetical protein
MELIDQLFGFERQRLGLAEAVAEVARLAKEAVDARLRHNETLRWEDRQAAREAEQAAYEAAREALNRAREFLEGTEQAAGVSTALALLDAEREDAQKELDGTMVFDVLHKHLKDLALEARSRTETALEPVHQAWAEGQAIQAEQRKAARHRRKARRRQPRGHSARRTSQREPTVDELRERAAERRATADELTVAARNLFRAAAESVEKTPEKTPDGGSLEGAVTAMLAAMQAEQEAEQLEARIRELEGGGEDGHTKPAAGEHEQPGAGGEPAPGEEPPAGQADGRTDPATGDDTAKALLAAGIDPLPTTPDPPPAPQPAPETPEDEPAEGAGAATEAGPDGGATVVPPQPATAATADEHGMEVLPPVPARVDQPGQEPDREGKQAEGEGTPSVAPAPKPDVDEDRADDGAEVEAATAPALVPGSPEGWRIDPGIESGIRFGPGLGADLPSPDGSGDWPVLDLEGGHDHPDGTIDPGMLPDLPVQPGEHHNVDIDPPLFPGEPSRGEDIEGGMHLPGSQGQPTGPQPDAGIDFGPWGPVVLPGSRRILGP